MAFAARGRQSRMVPSRFKIWPTPVARARQHLLGDDELAPYISRLVCRSFNLLYQCCFRRRKILESVRRLSEYLLARLVDICHSTRNRIQWNDEVLDDSDVIWRRCYWLIHQMTKRGCELWPRAPFCVSRFLSRARKEGCVYDSVRAWNNVSSYDMWWCPKLHVDRPGYTNPRRGPIVPNTGRNLSNSNYGGHDEEEEGMGCGKSFCVGGRHRTVDVMNWNVPQFFSNSKWNPRFISANLTEERYPLHDDASVFRNNQYALISVRYCIRCMQHHSRIELLMVTWLQQIFRHISAWHRTPQYIWIQSWYYTIFPSQNTVWAMATGR